ncbi:MAG: molybdopterin-containing oxidoreductase family protein [Bacillota bacterium]|jgi:anaerobic dimethyl sulfoxide reductase subunit A
MLYKDCETVYSSCMCNCGATSQCIFKLYVKDGKVMAIEPDDRLNTDADREDEVIPEEDLLKIKIQRRPCTRGLVFHRYLYQPERILYPLRRVPGTKRGEGKYERISWDEALDTICTAMREAKEKYGKYCVVTPQENAIAEQLFSHWGAGANCWGWASMDSARLMSHLIAGFRGWDEAGYASGSSADMLANSKLLVLVGQDATVGAQGPGYQFAYFVKMARERGKKVIIIDPRYTNAGEVLADQWIPIKPGTDATMYLALAYVLFKEDTWNHEFVEKYVEPKGFQSWKDLVFGVTDGVEKTPEWAEKHCAIPAETLWELGHLLGTVKPAWIWNHWAVNRKSRGENTMRIFAALQAMLGYWGTPGAGPIFHSGPMRPVPVEKAFGPTGNYQVPRLYRSHKFAQAILDLPKVKAGEKPAEEYIREIGWQADPKILDEFNPKILFWGGHEPFGSNHVDCAMESANYQIPAMDSFDLVINMHNRFTPTVKMADIILPAMDYMWEEKLVTKSYYGGSDSINFCAGVSEAPGEVRPRLWVYAKIAEGLGLDPKCMFSYYDCGKEFNREEWDKCWDKYCRDCYQGAIDYYAERGKTVPSWEDFKAGQFINCDEMEDTPHTGFDAQMKEGKPFKTESGKIEFFSNYVANEENKKNFVHYDTKGQLIDNLPTDWGEFKPYPEWRPANREFEDGTFEEYPITFLASVCRYRVHSLFWEQPWLRGQVYRHRVWINAADAKKRGIKDDDMVECYNDRGRIVMPAYVTNRIMPGCMLVRHGAAYTPGKDGIDFGASPSTLLGGDRKSLPVPALASNRAQIKKYEDKEGAE